MEKSKCLNLGCGLNHLSDYTNIDREQVATPDMLVDLEQFPWPWEDNTIEIIRLHHVLEHLGEKTEAYKRIMQEMYRICTPNACIRIAVPFFRHDNFWADFTHVRVITPLGLALLSRKNNEMWIKMGAANSSLALYWNVNFEIISTLFVSDPSMWLHVFPKITRDDEKHQQELITYSYVNNLIMEIHYELRVVK